MPMHGGYRKIEFVISAIELLTTTTADNKTLNKAGQDIVVILSR